MLGLLSPTEAHAGDLPLEHRPKTLSSKGGYKINPAEQAHRKQVSNEYVTNLKSQENSKLKPGKLIFANKPPEDAPKGEMDIAFGHKITPAERKSGKIYGIPWKKGITYKQAETILRKDIEVHANKAKKYLRKKGANFDRLDPTIQEVLIDYSFTGALTKFPKFVDAVINNDWATIEKEFKRYYTSKGKRKELVRRNKMIKEMLDKTK